MRVISGTARGKKLNSPDNYDVRPTLDRVKESIFNMIAFSIPESVVLDLFAGSGALGIEALSRGAKSAHFVDSSDLSLSITKENLALCSMQDRAVCINTDCIEFLENCTEQFDLIFLDPPYETGLLFSCLEKIFEKNLLISGGYIICETDVSLGFMPDEKQFHIVRNKKYGRVQIFLLTNLKK